jgi:hypothetical protein
VSALSPQALNLLRQLPPQRHHVDDAEQLRRPGNGSKNGDQADVRIDVPVNTAQDLRPL